MSKKDDGGPAFPAGFVPGMTLRQWYAGQALSGLLARSSSIIPFEATAKAAFGIADAMIKEGKND